MKGPHLLIGLVLAVLIHLVGVLLSPDFPMVIDVFLVLVVLNGLEGNSLSGLLGGLVCGLVQDSLSGEIYGLYAFAATLVGYVTARIAQRLVTQRLVVLLFVFVFAAVLQRATLYSLAFLLIQEPVLPPLPWAFLPIVTSSLLGLGLLAASQRLALWLQTRRRGRMY